MNFKLTFFLSTLLLSLSVAGQHYSHYTKSDRIKVDTLIDSKNGDKFIVDKTRIYITATNKQGKILWRTDPAIDNKLEKYRADRPTIVHFAFGSDRSEKNQNVIWITYSNTQFGYLDKRNGKFTFEGQD